MNGHPSSLLPADSVYSLRICSVLSSDDNKSVPEAAAAAAATTPDSPKTSSILRSRSSSIGSKFSCQKSVTFADPSDCDSIDAPPREKIDSSVSLPPSHQLSPMGTPVSSRSIAMRQSGRKNFVLQIPVPESCLQATLTLMFSSECMGSTVPLERVTSRPVTPRDLSPVFSSFRRPISPSHPIIAKPKKIGPAPTI